MKIKSGLIFAVAVAAGCMTGLAQPSSGTSGAATAATSTNAPGNEVMPLIVIDEAPLPDAIRNLARQANINIDLDKKAFSGVDAANKPIAQPTVSFRWENITPMQALEELLEGNGLQIKENPKTSVWRVSTKDPAALEPLIAKVLTLKYSHPTNVIPLIKSAFATPRSQVLADARTSQLVVLATADEQAKVKDLIEKLDLAPAQILIEARFIQASHNPKTAKGIDWTRTIAEHNISFGNNSKAPEIPETPVFPNLAPKQGTLLTPSLIMATTGGFGPVGFLNSDGLNAVVSFLNSDNNSETVATPRAVALEGVPTELSVVQNIPVFEEQQSAQSGGGNLSTVKANYELSVKGTVLNEVGTKLIVTPRIYGVTNVFMDLKPEISARGPDETKVFNGKPSTAPTFLRRRITTQAMVPTGNTLVLGGLREDFNSKVNNKVPVLGDTPGLGMFFRHNTKERDKRDLLIFVTPTIISQDDYVANAEARDFLKQKPVDKPEVSWGPLDSTTPKDWSAPLE